MTSLPYLRTALTANRFLTSLRGIQRQLSLHPNARSVTQQLGCLASSPHHDHAHELQRPCTSTASPASSDHLESLTLHQKQQRPLSFQLPIFLAAGVMPPSLLLVPRIPLTMTLQPCKGGTFAPGRSNDQGTTTYSQQTYNTSSPGAILSSLIYSTHRPNLISYASHTFSESLFLPITAALLSVSYCPHLRSSGSPPLPPP